MVTKYFLPALAIAGAIFAVMFVRAGNKPTPAALPVAQPAQAPFAASIAGAGLVEASTENIAMGTIVPGVVTEVFVRVGDDVKTGDPLFQIDDRELQAELRIRQAALDSVRQKLTKLENLPRPEDVPPAEAKLREAESALEDARELYRMWQEIPDKSAVSAEEMSRRKFAVQGADARLSEAKSNLALLKAGSWKPDLEIAKSDVTSAEAQVLAMQTAIERLTVRAQVDARVLQVKIRPGEYAPAGVMATPLVMLGQVDPLHVRVDIDENDAWRLKPDAPARAFVRGNRDLSTDLKFVRVEPYVVPKRSLTGESTERVDTRVLQVLYSFDRKNLPVYVGQQMDVFIEAQPSGK